MLVKRLVSIEDLGNIEVLFTDKTGTLTDGRITFDAALDAAGATVGRGPARSGCSATTRRADGHAVGGNQLDQALWEAPGAARRSAPTATSAWPIAPFDYERRLASVLVDDDGGKRHGHRQGRARRSCSRAAPTSSRTAAGGARRAVRAPAAAWSPSPPAGATARTSLDRRGRARPRARRVPDLRRSARRPTPPRPLRPPRAARTSRSRSSPATTTASPSKVCATSAWPSTGRCTGARARRPRRRPDSSPRCRATTIFARVTPEQKSRIIQAQRALGTTVGFLGDGVNDARRAARRRRRHLGRHRHRRRQGRRRHRPARQGPRRPRRRRRRGPAHLRQHHQVRADGHVVELREHVQRRRRLAVPAASCRCCRRRSCSTTCSTTPAR